MKSLKTVQTVSKVLRIIFKVMFILSVICGAFCIAGAAILGAFGGSISEEELAEMLEGAEASGLVITVASIGEMAVNILEAAVSMAGMAVIYKFAELYFKHELEDGTPFTKRGAGEMLRLGILTLAVPYASEIVNTIITVFYEQVNGTTFVGWSSSDGISVWLGVTLIIVSIVFKYGAELEARVKANDTANQQQDNSIHFDNDNSNNNDSNNDSNNNDGNGIFYV